METIKTRIRKNDEVQVIGGADSGKKSADNAADRGKRGKVLEIDRVKNKAKVQGIKMVYRHLPVSKDPNRPGGGRIQKEAFIHLSNLMLVCPKCNEPTRVGIRTEKQEREGGKVKTKRIRVCKECGGDIAERS